jgi:hypothetical protein
LLRIILDEVFLCIHWGEYDVSTIAVVSERPLGDDYDVATTIAGRFKHCEFQSTLRIGNSNGV